MITLLIFNVQSIMIVISGKTHFVRSQYMLKLKVLDLDVYRSLPILQTNCFFIFQSSPTPHHLPPINKLPECYFQPSLFFRSHFFADLVKEEYTFGRGENCDVAFNNTGKRNQCFQAYSKVHFKLIRVSQLQMGAFCRPLFHKLY